jgi:hypothetical protein
MMEKRVRRAFCSILLLACIVALAIAALRWDASFRDPTAIFWWWGVPLLGTLLAAAFLVLPTSGQLALAATMLTLATLEAGAAALNAWTEPTVETWIDPQYYQAHPELGWAPKPGIETRAWKRVAGESVYDVRYSIDALGRRVTPAAAAGPRSTFLLFFGCSVTFGEGVEDTETFPHFVAQQAPQVRAYNYGFHGYGAQQLLARLETQDLRSEVTEPDGSLVYLFIDAHVNRAIGSMVVYTGWADTAPYYRPGPDEALVRDGTLTTGRPATSILYSILGHSQVLKRSQMDVPPAISERHIDLTARILAASARRFHEQFGGGRFVVVIFPGSTHAVPLGRALDRHGIEFLDYSALFDAADPAYAIPNDWHPSPRAHRRLAEQLVTDLGLGDS